MNTIDKQKIIFGRLFLLANKTRIIGDRVLSGEMTIRQWLLTAAIAQLKDNPPTMGEAARLMGSSHQNVKQLAAKLQERGFLMLEKHGEDFRETRLKLTEKNYCFWEKSQAVIRELLTEIFHDFSEEELDSIYQCFVKLYGSIKY
jgi:MarR family transcriptional regulator for hemolysin